MFHSDRVLWMCGGHKAVEGVTRNVKTAGEVEPCRLEVKAQAPIRKFAAMKDLVATIDCLVSEMKKKCTSLSGLFERSDAMVRLRLHLTQDHIVYGLKQSRLIFL